MTTLMSIVFFAGSSIFAVAPKFDKTVKNCPKDEVLIANEFLKLESLGRRAFGKTKDSCYKEATVKYIYQLKTESDVTNNVVFVESVKLKKVEYNKTYEQHDAFIEATMADGTKVEDQFRFMRMGLPDKKKPQSGCALLSIAPTKAYVLKKCQKK